MTEMDWTRPPSVSDIANWMCEKVSGDDPTDARRVAVEWIAEVLRSEVEKPDPTLDERRLAWAREALAKSLECDGAADLADYIRAGSNSWDKRIASLAASLADWRG